MICYLVQPKDRIFVKCYEFLSFVKNMSKHFGKKISNNLSDKYNQKRFDHAKISAADTRKTVSKN